MDAKDVHFFASPADFRRWLEANHKDATEVWVGFHRKDSGKPSITWPEAVDQALCFGWIDGIRKRVNETSYTNRFTPRKARSTWSAVNIKRVAELTEMGLMQPEGLEAFSRRSEERSAIYSFEAKKVALEPAQEELFRANEAAWSFFQSQAPSYRKAAIHWVTSARKEETRLKRLNILIEDSENRRKIAPLTRA